MLVGQFAALIALTWWLGTGLATTPDFSGDGVAVTLIIMISTPIQLVLLVAFAQRKGEAFAYLGLTLPRRSEVIFGVAVTIALIVIGNVVSWLLGKDIVTSFQSDIFRTAGEAGFLRWCCCGSRWWW